MTIAPKSRITMTAEQTDLVNDLANAGVLGDSADAVARALIDMAIRHMIDVEYVQKHLATMDMLRLRRRTL